jgi:hypothetical protein
MNQLNRTSRAMRPSRLVLILAATSALAHGSPARPAQQAVPIVDLPPATARTATTLGGVLGVREVPGGKVLVNDAFRRQLLMYDTTLASSRVVFDSIDGTPNSYGPYRVPLVPYLGDSSLMADLNARTLIVIDGQGAVARSLALPNMLDVGSFASGMTGVDSKGRLLYTAAGRIHMPGPGQTGPQEVFVDSLPIMRADLDARRVDTIGRVAKPQGEYARIDHTDPKTIIRTVFVNPLPAPDEWAVIADGSVAFVRGHDYHIDWVRPDGSTSSTPKLPFDWKRVTDDDKQKLIDSANAAHAAQNAFAAAARNAPPPPPPPPPNDGAGGTPRTGGGAGVTRAAYDAMGNLWVPLSYEVVAPKDIPDYYPAIRKGAAMADLDNHLWILPTTSAQSRNGELVYDVVNTKGELFERVRIPAGRLVAGFGKDGVVYLLAGDKTAGFYLERTKLPSAPR